MSQSNPYLLKGARWSFHPNLPLSVREKNNSMWFLLVMKTDDSAFANRVGVWNKKGFSAAAMPR